MRAASHASLHCACNSCRPKTRCECQRKPCKAAVKSPPPHLFRSSLTAPLDDIRKRLSRPLRKYTGDVALRVAAIDFLNPAPLMWDFHHPPLNSILATRYELHPTTPSKCAEALLEGRADLGLIPIAALTPELRIVPGCTIASLGKVRSIQLMW